jgi:hypothetical protein
MFFCRDSMNALTSQPPQLVWKLDGFNQLAFAISFEEKTNKLLLRLMTQAEVWAEAHIHIDRDYEAVQPRSGRAPKKWNEAARYYSPTGKLIDDDPVSGGREATDATRHRQDILIHSDISAVVKLGRFLCNDTLHIIDQFEVMIYLCGFDSEAVKTVVNCFYSYKIITRVHMFLGDLKSGRSSEYVLRELGQDQEKISEFIINRIIDPTQPGYAAISPIIRNAISKTVDAVHAIVTKPHAFGKETRMKRQRRAMRAFV